MPKSVSGKVAIKILQKRFGFYVVSQKGSHVKLKKQVFHGEITTIVPLHRELAFGTLRSVLELAQVDYRTFIQYL